MANQPPLDTPAQESAAGASSQSNLSSSAGSSMGIREVFRTDLQIQELRKLIPPIVAKYNFELRKEIAQLLDPLKDPRGNDWRLVASKLKFDSSFIENIKTNQSPTLKLLDSCTNTSTDEFLEVLSHPKVQRGDVIYVMLEYARSLGSRERSPTQETVSDWCSSPSSSLDMPTYDPPYSDSGVASKVSKISIGRQPSEQDAEDEIPPHVDFFSTESREFWKNMQSVSAREKSWKEFLQAIKTSDFGDELKGVVDRFLCIVLKLDYEKAKEQNVKLDDFLHLVAWFGPFRKGGCLTKMHQLMEKSVSRAPDHTKQSWFAGYMSLEETELSLRDQEPGRFLIRFSESKADDGFFVLAVKTRTGVETFQIEGSPSESSYHLKLGDQIYHDLHELVDDLRRNIRLEYCPVLLNNPCPNLRLNIIFKGYTKSTGVPPRHPGRGRGRARRNNPQS